MTDRICALTVALDRDIRDDDIAPLVAAVQQLRGVCGVTAHVVGMEDYAARSRANLDWRKKILEMLRSPDA